ncbi:MAG TPA: DUF4124 domain-containing protein [Steroidobacteraceae bacterium]|nr:DUF4124 domain-containing protein [Steroidobacteraceae bacterium]
MSNRLRTSILPARALRARRTPGALGAVALALGTALCFAILPSTAVSAAGQQWGGAGKDGVVFRWVDEHGGVHYGDSIPPQYAKDGATVLNDHGIVIGEVAPQKTAAELAAAARDEEELQKQHQRDSFLLTTYSSVKDIEQLRDERLGQLAGQRVAAEAYISNLHERLLALQARAMLFKPYDSERGARRMPDDLVEQLVRTLNEMRAQRGALDAKSEQESEMRAQFQADIDRFRELRAAASNRQPD